MRVWLVTVGEPLPIEEKDRPYRTGILSSYLVERGHQVVWWTSTFDHIRKTQRFSSNKRIDLPDGRVLQLLHGPGYAKNKSIIRILDHIAVARAFRKMANEEQPPDIIVCSYPTIELSAEVQRFCGARNIPYVLDIRDLWPDIFGMGLSAAAKFLSRPVFRYWDGLAISAIKGSAAVIGVSMQYLDWALEKSDRARTAFDGVIPLGYPASSNKAVDVGDGENAIAALGVDLSKKIVVFAGTFGETYDLSTPIAAIRSLPSDLADQFQFVFCGDGERRKLWTDLAKGHPSIVFTGWIDERRLRAVIDRADIGLAAYAYGAPQGLPNKIIEYMAAGLPILSSLRGEAEDLLAANACGLTYDPRNPDDFVEVLAEISEPSAQRVMAGNSAALFEAEFRADVVYRKYCALIEEIATIGVQCPGN